MMDARAVIRSLVGAVLSEQDSIGKYGAYPGGRGYEGGLDRPLHEPNPSVANPPPRSPDSPAPERSGKELYDLYKSFPGSTDQFYKGMSPGEVDNFEIHRDSEVRRGLGQPPIGGSTPPSAVPPPRTPPTTPSIKVPDV